MKIFRYLIASAVLTATASAESEAPALSSTLITRLVNEAMTNHPSVAAAQARTEAAAAAIGAVRLWEDPQLGLGFTLARRSMRADDGDLRLGVEQMLPRRGLYEAEKRKAVAEQQIQQAGQRQTANDLGLSVAQTLVELALADEVIRLQADNLSWLQTIVGVAEERAKNPDGTATETLRLESELAMRTQTLASAKRQRAQKARTLNLLLGRTSEQPWQPLTLPDQTKESPGVAALKTRLENANPQLAALRHQIEGAQAEADAAREKRKPILSVGVETSTYSGGDFRDAMFGLKVSLPWFNRSAYQANLARAEKLQEASRGDLAAHQLVLNNQLFGLLTEVENNRQFVSAYRNEVLPKSEKAVETLQGAWVSSKATLLEVLDARRTLLEARQEQKRALAAEHAALQSLTNLTGGFTPTISKKP